MTPKQKDQFNRMRLALRRIYNDYMEPSGIRKHAEEEYGLEYEEALEIAYENIQWEAKNAVKGVRHLK